MIYGNTVMIMTSVMIIKISDVDNYMYMNLWDSSDCDV